MCGNHMDLKKRVDALEKELEALKKDYGRLCQNDSVMRTELLVAIKRLDKQNEEINDLKLIITNLHNECQRLYTTGFSNGVEVARKEFADEFKKLEDRGLITCHGFLKKEPNDDLDKLTENMYNQLGIHTDKLEPISATKIADEAWHKWADSIFSKHYEQVDKAVKTESASELDEKCKSLEERTEPLKTCYTKLCTGCKDLHSDGYDLINRGYRLYTCKKKGVSVLSNIMPKPENFVAAFKKEEKK